MTRTQRTFVLLTLTLGALLAAAGPALGRARASSCSQGGDAVTSAQVADARKAAGELGVTEWLGPLAPVALSPFFGIALLSGLACFGGDRVAGDNPFLREGSPLDSPTVFVVFLALTALTSVPRFSKVSKPFAQAVDQVEAWGGVITLVALRVLVGAAADGGGGGGDEVALAQAGLFGSALDAALVVVGAVNVLVINAVKFFFEVLVWITPVPFLDAAFEAANKSACAGLVALYAISPAVATAVNLVLFLACLVVFRWVWRRQLFWRSMLFGALAEVLSKPRGRGPSHLVVYPVSAIGPIPARARCRFERAGAGWRLTAARFLRPALVVDVPSAEVTAEVETGLFTNTLRLTGPGVADCTFSRRHRGDLAHFGESLGVRAHAAAPDPGARGSLKAELG